MTAITPIESAARRLNDLKTEAARNRAAFSWDKVTFTKARAGFPSDKGEPREILIPSSLYALPIAVPGWDDVVESPRPKQLPGILTYNAGKKKFHREVYYTPIQKWSDLDFSKACAGVGGITHSATHDLIPMMSQPVWVTFAMNPYEARMLARLGRQRWEAYCASRHWAHDIKSTDHLGMFLQRAVLGAFDLFRAHADLFEIPPSGMTGVDVARVSAEILNCITYDKNTAHLDGRRIKEYAESIISNLQGVQNGSSPGFPQLMEAIQKFLITTLTDHGGHDAAVKEIRNYGCDDLKFLALVVDIQKRLPIRVRQSSHWAPPIMGWGYNEFTCAPLVDVLITWGTLDDSLADAGALRTYIENNAYALVTESPQADPKMVRFAKSLLQIWGTSPVLISGGEAQRMEYHRMSKVGWPHILSSTNSHRNAKPYITIGSFGDLGFSVRDLDTVKESHFIVPPEHMHLLCDRDGNFLSYSTVCEVLRKEYDDFSGDTTELKDFVANELPKASNPVLQQAFELALAMRFDIKKCYGFELDNDSFHRRMTEDGHEEKPLPSVSFHCGPEKYTMLALPSTRSFSADQVVTEVAAHAVNNGYADYGKTCWLRTRGLLGKEDSVTVKEWDPKKDLKKVQYQDWLDWCFEVAREDAGGQLNSYDGKYEIHHVDSLHFAAVTWRES
jgi:hypothetical protein